MGTRYLPMRLGLLAGLLGIMAWLFLAPHPLPSGIAVQREAGFLGHVGIFTLATLACTAAFPRAPWRVTASLLIAATCLEAAQIFVPTRGAEFADFAMNCIGILLGLIGFRFGAALLMRVHRKTARRI